MTALLKAFVFDLTQGSSPQHHHLPRIRAQLLSQAAAEFNYGNKSTKKRKSCVLNVTGYYRVTYCLSV